ALDSPTHHRRSTRCWCSPCWLARRHLVAASQCTHGNLLLLLRRFTCGRRLRENVRASQVRLTLVGYNLCEAARAPSRQRLKRRSSPAASRSRHLRSALDESSLACSPRNVRLPRASMLILLASIGRS